jgi:cytochrome b involved in lipid metabolism
MDSFNKVGLINKTKVEELIKKDRVIVYYGNTVLDVTDFKHPGPDTILIDNNGTDIKMDFDDQGHSNFAKSLISKFKIGKIKDNIYE